MKILWIGINFGLEMFKENEKRNGKLLSAYVSHNSIIEGLDSLGVDMDSVNSYHFKPQTIKDIKAERWSRTGKSDDVSVGFKNIKYVNHILSKKALCKEAGKWAERNKSEDVTVFVYEMHSPFMRAAIEVKKIIPSARICLIVPDLPQYMDLNMNPLKKVLKKIDWLGIKRLLHKIDKFILYAKPMAEFLGLRDGQWTVMEGLYDSGILAQTSDLKEDGTIPVMYSGVLDLRYGIPELLDAMNLLDERYELWLTGSGNAEI